LESEVDIDYTVYGMEAFYNGVILFTSKGIKRIDSKGNVQQVDTSKIKDEEIKAWTRGGSLVYAVSKAEEVFGVVMVFDTPGEPYAVAQPISIPISDMKWSDNPKMAYVSETLWIARDSDIYGYYQGAWKKQIDFEGHTIDHIVNFKDKLMVALYDVPDWKSVGITIDNSGDLI